MLLGEEALRRAGAELKLHDIIFTMSLSFSSIHFQKHFLCFFSFISIQF